MAWEAYYKACMRWEPAFDRCVLTQYTIWICAYPFSDKSLGSQIVNHIMRRVYQGDTRSRGSRCAKVQG